MPALTFHGHSCWEVRTASHRILFDPFLTGNDLADVGPGDFESLDAILLTHGHADHIGDTEAIAKATGALVVSNYEIASYFEARGCRVHPMHIGGGHAFDFGHVKLTIAHHGSTGPEGESLGNPTGIVLTSEGKRIYHAGDTGVFLDMQLIGELCGPLDVALLPIGDNFTMGINDAVRAAELLGARMNIPMHYNTFPPIQADPNVFVARAKDRGIDSAVVAPGEQHSIA